MLEAIDLGGFFTAHAIWLISNGESLIPFIGYQRQGEETPNIQWFEAERLEDAAQMATEDFDSNAMQAERAVLVCDGYVPTSFPLHRTDALCLTIYSYQHSDGMAVTIPYRHPDNPSGFAIHRPLFELSPEHTDDFYLCGKAFWQGVSRHAEGARVWDMYLDESVRVKQISRDNAISILYKV